MVHCRIHKSRSLVRTLNNLNPVHPFTPYLSKINLDIILPFAGPYHHGMVRRQVADGGDGLQIWRLAAKILN
jgi:hypothetical protein